MLSVENPPPGSDPPLPCPLKKKKPVNSPHLDLSSSSSSSSLDHHRHHHHHQSHIHPHNNNNVNPSQTPNFCIRDYVFAVRRKDFNKNWPFSSENLQLCLKHGVKQPLPPFQSFGSVKDKSLKPCTADITSDVAKKSKDPPTIQKLALNTENFKPCSENAFPSTATSAHQSEVECLESYPVLRSKTENRNRPTSKKCRLVVKFGNLSAEDVASNLTVATSELMASSKTCPVCKTFSSSSNTTLNAHIDQCLALVSKPVSASSSRVVRHKIKPRKIRLMTDIYAMGKECTLEELDRRNGTSWAAMGSNSPVSDGEWSEDVHKDGQSRRASLDCSRDSAGDQANVYVDANGTKVRILSKLVNDGAMAEKCVKGGKSFPAKRKSSKGKRKHKYLKLVPQSTKLLPKKKAHSSQVVVEPQGHSNQEEEGGEPQPTKLVSLPGGGSRQWMPAKEPSKRGCRKYPSSENNDSFARRGKVEKVTHVMVGHTERSLLPMKRSTHSISRSSENDRNYISPLGRRKICSSAGFGKDVEESPQIGSRTLPPCKKAPIRHQFAAENTGKTRFSFKRTGSHDLDGRNDELVGREPSTNPMQNGSESHHQIKDSSFGTCDPLSREEQLGSESPRMVSQFFHRDNGETVDFSPLVLDGFDDETSTWSDSDSGSDRKDDAMEDLDCQGIAEERAISSSLSRFMGTEFSRRSHSGTPFASSVDQYIRHSPEPSFLGGQEEYSARDDAISEKATCIYRDLDFETAQESPSPEVEPIPIPGPPGSFLPSPRDMIMTAEDFPTSPVLSSEDHPDFVDRVSSDSPLSMASTVSNSRPDHMKYFEQLSSAGMNPDSAASSLQSSVDEFAIEKSSLGFRSENQPCCCQGKERSLPSLNFQESLLLKRRTMASAERQTGFLPDMNPPSSRSQLSAPDNPCTALHSGPDMLVKTLSDTGGTSISPSASNPVLRLMGKNLMVINTAEETSTQLSHGGFISKPPVPLAATSAPQGSFVFDRDSFSSRVPQNLIRAAAGMFQSHYSAPFSLFNPQDSSSAPNPKNTHHFSFPSS